MTAPTPIRAAIVGYGNLGRSVERLVALQPDMELVGIFSRRDALDTDAPVFPVANAADHAGEIDVLFLCLGSATDIPEQAAGFAKLFTTVDTYDNHKLIPSHRTEMDAAARDGGNVAMISTGWDPGLFSINRTLAEALFPSAEQHTFWGPGLSQGHSDAIRRIPGVIRGVQYTVPREEALAAARTGGAEISGKDAHQRHGVVVADAADHDRIREAIVTMPDYFVGYETTVEFVSEDEFERDHQGMPHGGRVITSGDLAGSRSTVEFSLELERNPDFTGAAMVAYGRAAARMRAEGRVGAVTVLEVAPYLLSPASLDELIARDV
ncbi:diaminopimelate dehydrogenase [Gulosibacter macacae]|uniref:Meso-diaminopimelate D-dehydrogenase n=1 Tax=Gulosibacter macacae TaxID=2488791 RepID=A0A3P3VSR4_9MICO|nr:diaminopimelate dehydrogenase [Gulosibacter macacae]RRJ85795.1 diaminopimelate dehydrogenase [Gulosibacter macacae]